MISENEVGSVQSQQSSKGAANSEIPLQNQHYLNIFDNNSKSSLRDSSRDSSG